MGGSDLHWARPFQVVNIFNKVGFCKGKNILCFAVDKTFKK
jgi:hypothetical protein